MNSENQPENQEDKKFAQNEKLVKNLEEMKLTENIPVGYEFKSNLRQNLTQGFNSHQETKEIPATSDYSAPAFKENIINKLNFALKTVPALLILLVVIFSIKNNYFSTPLTNEEATETIDQIAFIEEPTPTESPASPVLEAQKNAQKPKSEADSPASNATSILQKIITEKAQTPQKPALPPKPPQLLTPKPEKQGLLELDSPILNIDYTNTPESEQPEIYNQIIKEFLLFQEPIEKIQVSASSPTTPKTITLNLTTEQNHKYRFIYRKAESFQSSAQNATNPTWEPISAEIIVE